MIPILSTTTTYTGQGLGRLSDAISCKVTHEINGEYELRMTYPVTGIIYDELQQDRIIWAAPDNMTREQGFRIYRITRPLNGIVTVYARHISYDASGVIVEPFTSASLQAALTDLPTKCVPSCPFTITSSRTVASQYKLTAPRSLWRVFGGEEGSMLDVYGGEWEFDNLTADLKSRIGADRGVEVRYGKNLTQLEQDITVEATYSAVYPFWYDEADGSLVTLPEHYITIPGAVGSRVMLLDLSGDFETQPSQSQLRDRANAYIAANDPGDPKISWKINMVMLSQSEEYAGLVVLDQVALGDTVHVYYEPMNLNATARAVKLTFNVLTERYDEITLGRVKQNLAKIIVAEQNATNQKIEVAKSSLERAIDQATDFIIHGAGVMRFIYNSSDELQEIVSLENPDITHTPQNVWRWNNGGLGFSPYGYAGPYTLALTQNGEIVADFITTGTMTAARIRAGLLTDELGKNSWDLDAGTLTITDGSLDIETSGENVDKISLHYTPNVPNPVPWTTTMAPSGLIASKYYPGIHVTRKGELKAENLTLSYIPDTGGTGTTINATTVSYLSYLITTADISAPNVTTTRMSLNRDGLIFYDSSGTETAKYPAGGYLKEVRTTADNYTLSSGGYAGITKPAELSGKKVVSADIYSYTSATGAFTVSGYNSRPQMAYIIGTPGATINDLIVQFWYIDN